MPASGTFTFNVTNINDAPVASSIEAPPLAYNENDGAVAVTSTIQFRDVDDTEIESAVVQFSGGYNATEDVLTFNDQSGITGSYDSLSGSWSLTGPATLAEFETAMRSITYTNTSENPDTSTRKLSFTVYDGDADSNTLTRDISITQVNDRPQLAAIESASLVYTENAAPLAVTRTIDISDIDDTGIESATVQITGDFVSLADRLGFEDQNGIGGDYDDTTGTLTLTGLATLADYEAALHSVVYSNLSDDPDLATRTVSISVYDGNNTSDVTSRLLDIIAQNDAPFNSASAPVNVQIVEDITGLVDLQAIQLQDADAGSNALTLTIASQNGGTLLVNQASGLVVEGSGTTAVTLHGSLTLLNEWLDTAQAISYVPLANVNGAAVDTLSINIRDNGYSGVGGGADIDLGDVSVSIVAVNDEPAGADSIITGQEDTTYIFNRQNFGFTDVVDSNANHQFTSLVISSLPESGTLIANGGALSVGDVISVIEIDQGLLAYAPATNDNGSGFGGFGFQVQDSGGTSNGGVDIDQSPNTISFDLPGVNDAPLLVANGATVAEGDRIVISSSMLHGTDADDPDPEELTLTLTRLPDHGELQLNGVTLTTGDQFSLQSVFDNALSYRHDESETSADVFSIELADGGEDRAQPASGDFPLTITEVIDPAPELVDDRLELQFGQSFDSSDGDLLLSGHSGLNRDGLEDTLRFTVELEVPPRHGFVELHPDGKFTYVHDGSFILQDEFQYGVTNEDGVFTIATVSIGIEPPLQRRRSDQAQPLQALRYYSR